MLIKGGRQSKGGGQKIGGEKMGEEREKVRYMIFFFSL